MAWISLLTFFITSALAVGPIKFLTKHMPETLRYISMDGRIVYVQKKPGVLGMISSFRSVDFLSDESTSDFLITGSFDRTRLAIEIVPNNHTEYNLFKKHKILVVNIGSTQAKEIGIGSSPKLHLKDEWISYFDALEKTIHIQNIQTQKKYEIKLSRKANSFFVPDVLMLAHDTVTYTDIDENGYAALISYNLISKTNSVIYRSPQNGTRLELCRHKDYMLIGDFPYEGLSRGSKILHIKLGSQINLAGHSTIYSSLEPDIGNMICVQDAAYFIKAISQNKALLTKTTDVVRLEVKTQKIEPRSTLGNITQLIEMDGRVMAPFRGDYYVIEGKSNLAVDVLKAVPGKQEELPLDI